MALCTSCGSDNPERAKFCLECGAQLPTAEVRDGGARKLVTVLFADVVGSTALGERLDPETMRGALARYFTAARIVLERHGGTVEKFIGDAVMAVFGVPLLHEDDALRAVRAALELRDEIARLNDRLSKERGLRVEFRIGVNSGMVVAGGEGSGSFVTGDAVNVAARLEQAATAGEVLIGEATHRLVRDYVHVEPAPPVAAKGKSEEVRAYRLAGLKAGGRGAADVSGRPFVGRRREMGRLNEAFEDAVADRRCVVFTLLGSAGVGKSRIVGEFLAARAGAAAIVRGRCLPYGEGITYWPVGEIVRAAVGAADDDDADTLAGRIRDAMKVDPNADQVAGLLTSMLGLATVTATDQERFWAVRRFLETQARGKPLICLIEDIHWAEAELLEMLESVADWTRDAPILLLCTARPELLETRPTWGGGKVNATTILLEPLNADQARELVAGLLGQRATSALVERILAAAEGNPLFAEEIVRMLGEASGTDVAGEQVQIPTSVQAVIAARLDRLPAGERAVAERAAVAGRVFERGAVLELVAEREREGVPDALLSLVRKELVAPSQPDITADEAFRFRHMLIRDTAYEALAKQERADLHERFAGWVERVAAERIDEYAEIVGYHLEMAVRYRRELALDDGRSAQLAERAGETLRGAGQRAYLRGDQQASLALLRRAVDLLPADSRRRRALMTIARLRSHGEAEHVQLAAAERVAAEAKAAGDETDALKGFLLGISPRAFSDPSYVPSSDTDRVFAALETFQSDGDVLGMALAESALATIYLGLANWAKSGAAAERGLNHAEALDDGPMVESLRFLMLNAALWGPMPAADVIVLADKVMAATKSRLTLTNVIGSRGLARAMTGDTAGARADVEEALQIKAELRDPRLAWIFASVPIEMVLGDLDAADRHVKRNTEVLETIGETGQRSTMWGFWARIHFDKGDPDADVMGCVDECRRLAASDDMVSQLQWRAALALVAARAGRIDEAKRTMAEATQIAYAENADFLYEQGLTELDRGYIHAQAGELEEARRRYQAALALFEQKGDLMDAGRARQRLAELGK